jgi:hypothetical protein
VAALPASSPTPRGDAADEPEEMGEGTADDGPFLVTLEDQGGADPAAVPVPADEAKAKEAKAGEPAAPAPAPTPPAAAPPPPAP